MVSAAGWLQNNYMSIETGTIASSIILYTLTKRNNQLARKNIIAVVNHISTHSHNYILFLPPLQLTATPLFAPHTPFSINPRHRSTLLVRIRQQRALVELLRAGRHVDGWVAREEVDRLEADFEDFAGHHGEVFDARNLWDIVVLVRRLG